MTHHSIFCSNQETQGQRKDGINEDGNSTTNGITSKFTKGGKAKYANYRANND